MKSYNNLYETLISDDNIRCAIINASRSHMKRKKLKRMGAYPEFFIDEVRDWIINYKPKHHNPKIINDGISAKKREIIVPTIQEHVVQHAVMLVLKPIFMKGMYEHSYASVPQRGCHRGAKVVKKWIKHDERNVKYCLKLDVRKYFQSVSQDILISKLNKIIRDKRFMALLENIIHVVPQGLPLGFYTSQWFANFYLQDFDHYIKEKLGVKHYIRYMDDMVIFDSNKKRLHKIKDSIVEYLHNNLALSLKDNWQVFRFDTRQHKGRFLDFMGFRFYRNKTTLRRKIALKAMRKAKRIFDKHKTTVHDARQMLTYIGWSKVTDTFNWLHNYILIYINFRRLRKQISRYDRKAVIICG